jgi:hypothetical protein
MVAGADRYWSGMFYAIAAALIDDLRFAADAAKSSEIFRR